MSAVIRKIGPRVTKLLSAKMWFFLDHGADYYGYCTFNALMTC